MASCDAVRGRWVATRALWLAWQYYFAGAPRYRVESAMIALVIIGAIIVALRRGDPHVDDAPDAAVPRWWLAVCVVAAPALYFRRHRSRLPLRRLHAAQHGAVQWPRVWYRLVFRPVPLLLWRGLLAAADTPVALHLLNLLLHGVNAYLVALLGRAMGMRREVALGAAALFLTFPALAEAVVWAAGIQDVLMTTMALGVVVLCARESPGRGRIALICALLILGFGSRRQRSASPLSSRCAG